MINAVKTKPKSKKTYHIVIDGNEANVSKRVGSNVYAFEIIKNLELLTRNNKKFQFTILLSQPRVKDLPNKRKNWQYQVIGPKPLWTQWALPLHLFFNQKKYDCLYTPGHYAPRLSAVPYISSVMDLAYLEYPEQFRKNDLLQLKKWTQYSVKNAQKVIAISQFSKKEIIKYYKKESKNIAVAYPSVSLPQKPTLLSRERAFFRKHHIKEPYFLFVGTLQPRKNIERLIDAFEIFSRRLATQKLRKKTKIKKSQQQIPSLVIAGKIGWLAEAIINRTKNSPFQKRIVLTGFIPEYMKPALYTNAIATVLVGLYEGFGIPPLESMHYQTLAIVSQTSSLPEVVGEAGILVDPLDAKNIAQGMEKIWNMNARQKAIFKKKTRLQIKKFDWYKSSQIVLDTILETATKNHVRK